MGGVDQYFSLVALFILFRETVEASIIVSVLLQFLSRSFPHLRKQVWWGVTFGILLSIVFGIVFSILFYVAKNNLFTGESKNIFKGSIAWFAGILITILAFAMLRYKGWEDKIKRKLEILAAKELEKQKRGDVEDPVPTTWHGKAKYRTCKCMSAAFGPVVRVGTLFYNWINYSVGSCMDHTSSAVNASAQHLPWDWCRPKEHPKEVKSELVGEHAEVAVEGSHGWGIFLIVFTTVLREGVESVVFLAGVGNAEPSSLPLPGLVGFICGIGVGMFLYYTGKQVKDIKWFLIIMAVVLFFIAGGQFMLGANYLMQGGMFGYCSIWINNRPWYMQPVWDLSSCCAATDDNKFFMLARAIFGYTDRPSMIEITVYFGYWFIIICWGIFKYFTGSLFDADYKHKRMLKKQAKEEAMREQQLAEQLELVDGMDVKKLPLDLGTSTDLGSQTADHSSTGSGGNTSPGFSNSPSAAQTPTQLESTPEDLHTLAPAVVQAPAK